MNIYENVSGVKCTKLYIFSIDNVQNKLIIRANFSQVRFSLIAVFKLCFVASHVWRDNSSAEPHSGRCVPRPGCWCYDTLVLAL